MTLLLTLLLLGSPWPQEATRGIEAGAALAPSAPCSGRILDAETGAPLQGVRLEVWTENWDHAAVRIDAGESALDGGFGLAAERGAQRGEKLLLRAPGYRPTTLPLARGEEILLVPARGECRVRVLDLAGEPISGAYLRSHQTCRHAPAAFEATSGADGWLDLSGLASASENAEYEVLAPGHGAVGPLWPGDLFPAGGDRGVIHLPRRRPLELEVLLRDGTPAANRRLTVGFAPRWQAVRTDARGQVRVASLFGDDEQVYLREAGLEEWLGEDGFPRDGRVRLRVDAEEVDRERLGATLHLPEGNPATLLFHGSGWVGKGRGRTAVPPGRLRAVAGGDFSGWRERSLTVELADGEERTLELATIPEPRLRLDPGPWRLTRVHAETGDHSGSWPRLRETAFPVPAGRPGILWVEAIDAAGEHRVFHRLPFPALEEDLELTLDPASRVLDAPPRPTLAVRVRAGSGTTPLPSARVEALGLGGRLERVPGEDSPGTATFDVPLGEAIEVWVRAPGHVPRCRSLDPTAGGDDVSLDLVPRAGLRATGFRALRLLGTRHLAPEEGPLTLDDLAPGPLKVEFEDSTGRVGTRTLTLRAGEVLDLAP